MIFRKQAILLVVGALVLSMGTGCSRNPAGVGDEPTEEPTQEQPNFNNGNNNNNWNNNGNGSIFNPGGNQTTTPVQINATVTNKKMKGILLWKKIDVVTVQLQNPSNQSVSGKLTVTFSKKGQQVETQEQTFSLSGGQTTTVEVKPTQSSDDAVASATSDSALGGGTTGGGFGGGTGFGGGSSFGGGTGFGGGTTF